MVERKKLNGARDCFVTLSASEWQRYAHYSGFDPPQIHVEPGETVRFVLTNTDPIDHEFILGDEQVQRIHEEGTEAHHGAKPGEITVHAGTTNETTYTFPDGGAVIFGCHSPGHYAYGMRGLVIVG